VGGDTEYLVRTNLLGAYHCLELARRHSAQMIFLSTSRVYPVEAQERIAWTEAETRFEIAPEQKLRGVSPEGIAENFPLRGPRTLYGATKLSAELLIGEYGETFGIPATIDRCGVIAGPWQMGKVDQGVFTHWVLSHYAGRPLRYIGYGGTGKQVRDLLHIDDLVDLIEDQLARPDHWAGVTANVGGGRECSLSLLETTELCRELTGNEVPVEPSDETRPGDVRVYLSDCARLFASTEWRPQRTPRDVLADILDWIRENERSVLTALG
jgi:CDP-paratose 2-epimerase